MNRLLANDCPGVLVDAQAPKYRVANMFLPCPLAKRNLSHQLRLDPMDISGNAGRLGKRVLVGSGLTQLRFQFAKCLIAEPRADVTRIPEFIFFIIKAQQKRTDPNPGTLRVGIPADDEFLTLAAFQLYPVG